MNITQCNPPIPVYIPERHETGLAHFVIDYGIEHHLQWVVFMDESTEVWTLPNPRVRAQKNVTVGRFPPETKPNMSPIRQEKK